MPRPIAKSRDWPDTVTMAWCWRSGVIGFGNFVPNGALPIASSRERERLTDVVQGNARWSYPPNSVPLVPGIPEASTDEEALERLHEFSERVRDVLAAPPEKRPTRRRKRAA